MAIKQTNIFPLDQQPSKAVGLSYPFLKQSYSGSSSPFKLNYVTKDQIKSNLIVYFTTKPGERPLNPDYGGGLYDVLFDQLTPNTYDIVHKRVTDDLAIYFPEVNLKKLEILEDIDSNSLKVVMSYTVFNNDEDNLELNFNP